jgi:hypothetical protein
MTRTGRGKKSLAPIALRAGRRCEIRHGNLAGDAFVTSGAKTNRASKHRYMRIGELYSDLRLERG